jgi:hypothetical protein
MPPVKTTTFVRDRRVVIPINNTPNVFYFIEYPDGTCCFGTTENRLCSQVVVPVTRSYDTFTRPQVRAIFLLWMLITHRAQHQYLTYIPYFTHVLSTLMKTAPGAVKCMTKHQFKLFVFDIWSVDFNCSDETVDSVLEDLVEYMPHWTVLYTSNRKLMSL